MNVKHEYNATELVARTMLPNFNTVENTTAGASALVIGILSLLLIPPVGAVEQTGREQSLLPDERRVIENQFGMVVQDAAGRRANYSKYELTVQKANAEKAPAASPVVDSFPRAPEAVAGAGFSANAIWGYAALGSGIGKSNIVLAESGGQREIYLGGSTSTFGDDNYWYVLAHNTETGQYDTRFVSPYFSMGIARIEVADVVGGPRNEILVALSDGRIQIYDQPTRTWRAEVQTSANGLTGLAVADVDGDGRNEIVVCNSSQTYIYSGNGSLKATVPNFGGQDLAIAQMDADPSLEIAATDGQILDALTLSVQWSWPAGFGNILEAADIDGDGMDELIAAEAWYFVWSYDVDQELPKWSIPTDWDIGAIHVTDIDEDSVQELLVGDGQWGDVSAYDTVTQALEWAISNPEHGVTDIAVGDVDGDGDTELLWGAGATSTGEDHLYVTDWVAEQIEWENIHLDGPFVGPEMGDLDGDGAEEVVVASWESDSGYGSGRILVFDSRTLQLRAVSDGIVGDFAWTGLHDLRLRDVDDDGQLEILVAADNLYDGVIEIYDFDLQNNFTLVWTNTFRPSGAPFYAVDAADVDNDGELEVVAGAGREHTGADGVFIYVYDYATGDEEWHSLQMGDYWDAITGLELSDIDRDGILEIIGMVGGGDVYAFDGQSKELQAILVGDHTDIDVVERAFPIIVLSDTAGDIAFYLFAIGDFREIARQNVVSYPIDGFSVTNLRNIWVGAGGTLRLVNAGATIWESLTYGAVFGKRTRRLPTSFMLLSTGSYGVIGFLPSLPQ